MPPIGAEPPTIGDATDEVLPSSITTSDTLTVGAKAGHEKTDTATVGAYERPIHAALRGLVPSYGDGRLWGGAGAGVTASALRPRPPDCVQGPAYFGCMHQQRLWHDDSIYHVIFRCGQRSKKLPILQPPDCARFLADTSKS